MSDGVGILKLLRIAGCLGILAAIAWFVSDNQAYAGSRRVYAQIIPQDVSQSTEIPKGDVWQTESDRMVTAKIREALEEDVSLFEKVRNIRIITINGEVTLRGQVNTGSERQRIEEKARKPIGVGRVINQIDVSP
ncbi:MAG TPA: BON domain-containing protein [bacterium]|nr:BON domain-containing protein [bacterium]